MARQRSTGMIIAHHNGVIASRALAYWRHMNNVIYVRQKNSLARLAFSFTGILSTGM